MHPVGYQQPPLEGVYELIAHCVIIELVSSLLWQLHVAGMLPVISDCNKDIVGNQTAQNFGS